MTRDFTCSVSEFTSLTGSICVFPYVHSPDSVNKFGVSTRAYHEIISFSRNDTYHSTSETVSVLPQYDSFQIHSKLMTTGRTCEYT